MAPGVSYLVASASSRRVSSGQIAQLTDRGGGPCGNGHYCHTRIATSRKSLGDQGAELVSIRRRFLDEYAPFGASGVA